ncbi:hypothetical protein BVG19_g3020 [[Candida] boidinii]|nr:hypothetical protein BVG19_g3020 [[Candida] boidinii]OWB50020.1 hypothetical protein B5S27_g1566 [[Candida] boidinii]
MANPTDARRSNDSFAYSTDGSLITDTSSLDSEANERAQQENERRSIKVEEYRRYDNLNPIHSVNSRNSIINRVRSTTSSFGDMAVKVNTLTKTVSQSVAAILEQARDDDIQTSKEKEELKHTKAGRVMSDFQLHDAFKIAEQMEESENDEEQKQREHNASKTKSELLKSTSLLRKGSTRTSIIHPDVFQTVSHVFHEDSYDAASKNDIEGGINVTDSAGEETIGKEKSDKEDLYKLTKEKTQAPVYEQDKGYCWMIAVCSCLLLFSTWGSSAGYGVFLGYFLRENIFPGASAIDFALVGSIILCIAQAIAPVVMIISAVIGFRLTMIIGLCLQSAGYILCSFATKLTHIYVCLGFMVGLGFAFVINPGLVIMPSWFNKYRATASGITVMGTGLGGVVFTLASQSLIDTTHDYKWSARMVGIVVFVVNLFVATFMKERVPTKKIRTWKALKSRINLIFNVEILKNYPIWLVTSFYVLGQIAYIIISYSINTYASSIGLSLTEGSHLTSIFNAGQIFGRLMIGRLGDNYGRSNVSFFLSAVISIIILCMWPFCKSFISMLFFSILAGALCPVSNTLHISLLSNCVTASVYPAAWSFENFFAGCFALISEPVSIKLRNLDSNFPFLKSQLFCGFLMFGSTLFVLPLREWRVKKVVEIRFENTQQQLIDINSQWYKDQQMNATSDNSSGDENDFLTNDVGRRVVTATVRESGLVQKEPAFEDNEDKLIKRLNMYRKLLKPGMKGYLIRMCYPIVI